MCQRDKSQSRWRSWAANSRHGAWAGIWAHSSTASTEHRTNWKQLEAFNLEVHSSDGLAPASPQHVTLTPQHHRPGNQANVRTYVHVCMCKSVLDLYNFCIYILYCASLRKVFIRSWSFLVEFWGLLSIGLYHLNGIVSLLKIGSYHLGYTDGIVSLVRIRLYCLDGIVSLCPALFKYLLSLLLGLLLWQRLKALCLSWSWF